MTRSLFPLLVAGTLAAPALAYPASSHAGLKDLVKQAKEEVKSTAKEAAHEAKSQAKSTAVNVEQELKQQVKATHAQLDAAVKDARQQFEDTKDALLARAKREVTKAELTVKRAKDQLQAAALSGVGQAKAEAQKAYMEAIGEYTKAQRNLKSAMSSALTKTKAAGDVPQVILGKSKSGLSFVKKDTDSKKPQTADSDRRESPAPLRGKAKQNTPRISAGKK